MDEKKWILVDWRDWFGWHIFIMLNKLVRYLLFGVLLVSCSDSSISDIEGKIEIDVSRLEKIAFNDIFSKIEIIPLETNKNALIGHVRKTILYEGNYYIEDHKQNQVFVFNENGEFLNKIGILGRGPGEYQVLQDFNINHSNDNVEILTVNSSRIIVYNKFGTYLETHLLPDEIRAPRSFCVVNLDTIILSSFFDDSKIYYYSMSSNKIFGQVKRKSDFEIRSVGKVRYLPPIYKYDNKIFYSEAFSNDCFQYVENQFIKKYSWDFGKYNFNIDKDLPKGKDREFYSNYIRDLGDKKVMWFRYNIENEQYIITSFSCMSSWCTLLYNKMTKTYKLFNEYIEGGSFPFYPDFFEEGVYMIMDASMLGFALPSGVLSNKNQSILKNIKISDNPVLIKFYFK